jgi:hypothetical protein
MKHAWHRQVRILTAIGIAGVVFFAVAVGPALAHPAKPVTHTVAGHVLRLPAKHGVAAPLGTALVTVNGVLENFDGTPFTGGALVIWNTSDWQHGGAYTFTDASGNFTFTNVDSVADGLIGAEYPDGTYLLFTNQNFASGSVVLQPGSVGVTVTGQTGSSLVDLWGGSLDLSYSVLAAPSGHTVLAPPGAIDRGVVYIDDSAAILWQGSATVVAGAQSATSVDVDTSDALGVSIPGWASGAAGTKISYRMINWPKDTKVSIGGFSEYREYAGHDFGMWTSPGVSVTRTFIVPKAAVPGYAYQIHSDRVADSPVTENGLDVHDDFQVCLLRSSSWTIRRGHSIVLSGIIPTTTMAHAPSHPGPKKWMIVFGRTMAAGQPPDWDATLSGWHKVARVQAGTSGYFKTAVLRPTKTTWYVVRYPGDGWNWSAFTQVIKVTVIG